MKYMLAFKYIYVLKLIFFSLFVSVNLYEPCLKNKKDVWDESLKLFTVLQIVAGNQEHQHQHLLSVLCSTHFPYFITGICYKYMNE